MVVEERAELLCADHTGGSVAVAGVSVVAFAAAAADGELAEDFTDVVGGLDFVDFEFTVEAFKHFVVVTPIVVRLCFLLLPHCSKSKIENQKSKLFISISILIIVIRVSSNPEILFFGIEELRFGDSED